MYVCVMTKKEIKEHETLGINLEVIIEMMVLLMGGLLISWTCTKSISSSCLLWSSLISERIGEQARGFLTSIFLDMMLALDVKYDDSLG